LKIIFSVMLTFMSLSFSIVFRRVRTITKSDYHLRHGCQSFRASVRSYGTTHLLPYVFR
jgi:hypothetical protein